MATGEFASPRDGHRFEVGQLSLAPSLSTCAPCGGILRPFPGDGGSVLGRFSRVSQQPFLGCPQPCRCAKPTCDVR